MVFDTYTGLFAINTTNETYIGTYSFIIQGRPAIGEGKSFNFLLKIDENTKPNFHAKLVN